MLVGDFVDLGAPTTQVQWLICRLEQAAKAQGGQVQKRFEGRLIAIDVKHPLDYRGSVPPRRSEGWLIVGDAYSRGLDDGTLVAL